MGAAASIRPAGRLGSVRSGDGSALRSLMKMRRSDLPGGLGTTCSGDEVGSAAFDAGATSVYLSQVRSPLSFTHAKSSSRS
jgi:hypothetical protein